MTMPTHLITTRLAAGVRPPPEEPAAFTAHQGPDYAAIALHRLLLRRRRGAAGPRAGVAEAVTS